MDENIGAKGQGNDRRRTIIAVKRGIEKLEAEKEEQQEIESLEKKVKKQQIQTFLMIMPLMVTATVIDRLFNITHKDAESKLKLPTSSAENHKKTSYLTTDENNNIVEVVITTDQYNKDKVKAVAVYPESKERKAKLEITPEGIAEFGEVEVSEIKEGNVEYIKQIHNSISEKEERANSATADFPEEYREKIDKIKNRKIVDEYEKKLKEIRADLRNLIFEYNVVNDSADKTYSVEQMQALMDKLGEIIKKIDSLKNKIDIDNLDKYDDNYIYTLVEDYFMMFQHKQIIDEIKDSPLYILISEKLEELDNKKDVLNDKLEKKKEFLELSDEKLDELKEKFRNFDSINEKITKIQEEQNLILKEMMEKVANSTTVTERTVATVRGLNRQSRRLMNFAALQMLLPGARSAKGLVAATAISLYYMRQLINPDVTTRTYKEIKVEDYSKQIESSIESLDNVLELIGKTSEQIDKTISEIKNKYKELIGVNKEFDEVIANLESVKDSVLEKEFEIQRLKKEQELILEKNNSKVKTK